MEPEGNERRKWRRQEYQQEGAQGRPGRCLETDSDEHARNPRALSVTTARDFYGHHAHAYRPRHEAYEPATEREVRLQPFDHTHPAVPPLIRFTTQFDRYVDCIMSELVRFVSVMRAQGVGGADPLF